MLRKIGEFSVLPILIIGLISLVYGSFQSPEWNFFSIAGLIGILASAILFIFLELTDYSAYQTDSSENSSDSEKK